MDWGSMANAINGAINGTVDNVWRGINYWNQKEQQNYDRQLQERIFQREDTSIQRAAADMQAAGLSKTLAAGSGADAGQAIMSRVPQMEKLDTPDLSALMKGIELDLYAKQVMAGVGHTQAETDLTREKQVGERIENQYREELLQQQVSINPWKETEIKYNIDLMAYKMNEVDEQRKLAIANRDYVEVERLDKYESFLERKQKNFMQMREDLMDIDSGSRRGGESFSATNLGAILDLINRTGYGHKMPLGSRAVDNYLDMLDNLLDKASQLSNNLNIGGNR